MTHPDLSDFTTTSPYAEQEGTHPTTTCGVCGQQYQQAKENCPHCGHDGSKKTSLESGSTNRPTKPDESDDRSPLNVTLGNPEQWGVGILVSAPIADLAGSFAETATNHLRTVTNSHTGKDGYRRPSIELGGGEDGILLEPLEDLNPSRSCIPLSDGKNDDVVERLVEATDWDAREPKPFLYTEYGEPLVERDQFEQYVGQEKPNWIVVGLATATVTSFDMKTYTGPLKCGYCQAETEHTFAGRDGEPDSEIDPQMLEPVWECAECGNYRFGPDGSNLPGKPPVTTGDSSGGESQESTDTTFIEVDPDPNLIPERGQGPDSRPDFPESPPDDLRRRDDSPTLT